VTELILALDVTDRNRALSVAAACAPFLDAIKIGYPLVLSTGLSIARDLADLGLPIIADFKVADIPNTNRLITGLVFDSGCRAIICHGFAGSDSVCACVDTAHDAGGACYVVAEMSHPGGLEFFNHGVASRIAALAVACGADGIIAPATRPAHVALLRDIVGSRKIYAPGVGAQGGDLGAVAGIVDGVIVGRAIYGAAEPDTAAAGYANIRR
jgi:orotidine-5'-phosphate decarboxylase